MSVTKSEIRPGAYYDSVVLMELQRNLVELPDVEDAGVVMATPANLELLADSHLLTPDGKRANPDDLLIVVRANDNKSAQAALGKVDELIQQRRSVISQEFRPHSLEAALEQLPEAKWVIISVPGRYAAGVAQSALDLNMHVFLYSDNVSIEDEVKLKENAREKGLLVMGPDCGTSIINGVGLGFANAVRRGPIGLVGASGTGIQAVSAHIHNEGSGITHAIGTGGRDLKSQVKAITTLQGLELLKSDSDTKVIVLVSKPPDETIAAQLLSAAQEIGKPIVVNFIGYPPPARQFGNLHFSTSLKETADMAIKLSNQGTEQIHKNEDNKPAEGYLRGLFSGGTLAYEMLLGLQNILAPIYSNVPISEAQKLENPINSKAHSIIDLGEDIFTVGRLHPMLDNDLRIRRIKQEAEDPETGIILIDLVLGEGSHSDPASELAPVFKDILTKRKDIEAISLVIGTDEDPQEVDAQIKKLKDAGLLIFRDGLEVVEYVSSRYQGGKSNGFTAIALEDIQVPVAAINVGLESFFESLTSQGAQAIHIDWRPPAGGNEKMIDILAKLRN